ncbi:MAG TPA: glycosyltransferase family 39 protein [Aggregatilineales bacterium]|nr:glycosyltransferase family 39 protein [Aggregatilineales bacterium]
MIPDWLEPTVRLFPALLWFSLGVGYFWAVAILPRADRRQPILVIAVALALGPVATTSAMFLIGTFGTFSRENVLIASIAVALLGAILAWWNRSPREGESDSWRPSAVDYTLIAVIAVAVILRFWNTAYWPYTTYDEFWVYGYNAKIFLMQGRIPSSLGYYPPLLPLAYTFMQLMWGSISDHAARTVVPLFALGSILMAYVLGKKLFGPRVGLLTAAIWALYPQHAAWSQFGDLEVPVTLYFTGTAAFFIAGWRDRNSRDVLLSGLLLGSALWTKPTAGALIESLALIGAAIAVSHFLRTAPRLPSEPRTQRLAAALPHVIQSASFRDVCLAGLAALPIGGMWYVRNMLLGHAPLVFPAGYWQDQAQRSGAELGWPLLIAGGLVGLLLVKRRRVRVGVAGFGLLLVATLHSAFAERFPTLSEWSEMLIGGIADHPKPAPLRIIDLILIGIGLLLLAWATLPLWRGLSMSQRRLLLLIAAFIVPYFVTWFWSYSYHYRLSFAIIPLFAVLVAAPIDRITRSLPARAPYTLAGMTLILALSLPGFGAFLGALEPAITGSLPDDHARIARGNAALMGLVDFLTAARNRLGRPLKVEAPGELRLAFFFPEDDIRAGDYPIHTGDYPTLLDQIADVDYFIDSSAGQRLYGENNKLDHNQILASLTRDNVMTRVYTIDDGNFRFSVYTIHNVARFTPPKPNGPLNVKLGDFATLAGYDLSTLIQYPNEALYLTLWWTDIHPATADYSVFIHLWDSKNQRAIAIWGGQPVSGAFSVWHNVPGTHFSVAYPTRLWQPGETIKDEWRVVIPGDAPPGTYELRVGLFDPPAGDRLHVFKDGGDIGDSVKLNDITIPAR